MTTSSSAIHSIVVTRLHILPIHYLPPVSHICSTPVLVHDVVRVLPDVERQQWDHLFHRRSVLVGSGLDVDLVAILRRSIKPSPTRAKNIITKRAERFLELIKALECLVDLVEQEAALRRGVILARSAHNLPEKAVVNEATTHITNLGAERLGELVQLGENIVNALVDNGNKGCVLASIVKGETELVSICLVVHVVVEVHSLLGEDGL